MADAKPWRMLLKGAFEDGWLMSEQDEKDRVFRYWIDCLRKWTDHGAAFISSLDSEMLHVGEAVNGAWNFYLVFQIPEPGVAKELLDYFRYPKDGGPRLDKYFRFEAVVGHPVGSVDRAFE